MSEYVKDPEQPAVACVIWMHGLGADAKDMMGLADALAMNVPIRHVFLDAPVRPVTLNNGLSMRAWYDILGLDSKSREDSEGVKQSAKTIRSVMDAQIAAGFTSEQLFLAGFSQGGAMALYTGVHTEARLGGIIALSAYLPLASLCQIVAHPSTPIFIAGGLYDSMVLPAWTKQVIKRLKAAGFSKVTSHEYPMEHQICAQEITALSQWLQLQTTTMAPVRGEST